MGFILLMKELRWERLQIAIAGIAAAEAALEWTMDYVRERKAVRPDRHGFPEYELKLAELKTEVLVGRIFVDHCIQQMMEGELDRHGGDGQVLGQRPPMQGDRPVPAAPRRLWLHDGIPDRPAYADARVQRIYGGTNEIMKELIAQRFNRIVPGGGPSEAKRSTSAPETGDGHRKLRRRNDDAYIYDAAHAARQGQEGRLAARGDAGAPAP